MISELMKINGAPVLIVSMGALIVLLAVEFVQLRIDVNRMRRFVIRDYKRRRKEEEERKYHDYT